MKHQVNISPENLLTEEQLSKRYGIAQKTLRAWRSAKKGPPYIKDGGYIRYPLDEFKAYLMRHYQKTAS